LCYISPHMRTKAFLLLACSTAMACSSADSPTEDAQNDELRTDPNAVVLTQDPSAHLLGGYNAFLDRTTTTTCVIARGEPQINAADPRGEFYLRHVTSK